MARIPPAGRDEEAGENGRIALTEGRRNVLEAMAEGEKLAEAEAARCERWGGRVASAGGAAGREVGFHASVAFQ